MTFGRLKVTQSEALVYIPKIDINNGIALFEVGVKK